MKIIKSKYVRCLVALFILSACGGDDEGSEPIQGGGDDDPIVVVPDPAASILIFPANNTECNEGTIVSETESDVKFRWNTSANTDSYSITLINLLDNQSSSVVQGNTETTFRLQRGTPYEWFVKSMSADTDKTSTSEKWRFFNEGPGIENYAPFPAEAISPPRGSSLATTTAIILEWTASDIDDDLKEFEIFLGTTEDNMASLGKFIETSINNVTVRAATDYYWKVKATDNEGNSSLSEVFQFKIN